MTNCICPDFWAELLGGCAGGFCYFDDCPAYTSCGGWTWDPPSARTLDLCRFLQV